MIWFVQIVLLVKILILIFVFKWSFGCILVELFTGYPIFPGENEAEQLAMIMEVIDLPPANVLAEASRRKLFFDSKNMPRNLNTKLFKKRRVGSRSLAQILKTTDTNFIDFVSRCLELVYSALTFFRLK